MSNVNGYVHDVKAISDLAHAHGAYLYCDAIQAAGAVPIDVKALGIDFLACSAYKFLMGGRFGYLYVREDLQGTALKAEVVRWPQHGSGRVALRGQYGKPFRLRMPASSAAVHSRVGGESIQAHAHPLIQRLKKDLPAAGYPTITPTNSMSSIVSFQVKDAAATRDRLKKANVIATAGNNLRVSVSVFNNMADVSQLVEALS